MISWLSFEDAYKSNLYSINKCREPDSCRYTQVIWNLSKFHIHVYYLHACMLYEVQIISYKQKHVKFLYAMMKNKCYSDLYVIWKIVENAYNVYKSNSKNCSSSNIVWNFNNFHVTIGVLVQLVLHVACQV
jgi:hypothetical protein